MSKENGKKKVGAVLVQGGGIAGVQASLDLANSGLKVYLLEQSPVIGGMMARLDKTFPTGDCATSANCTVVNGTNVSLANGTVNNAYVVLAVNSCGSKSTTATAQRVGVFHFAIEAGTP